MEKLFKKLKFSFGFFILSLFLVLSVVWADTNGVWTYAEDIRGGVFGGDEVNEVNNFTFINKVFFGEKLYSLFNPSIYFINLSGRSQLNNLATEIFSTNMLQLGNVINCDGKLYTNALGEVTCGFDRFEDADSDSSNELPIAGYGINVSSDGRTINIDSNEVALKEEIWRLANEIEDLNQRILNLENQINTVSESIPDPFPLINFKAEDTSIRTDQFYNVSWNVLYADSCYASGDSIPGWIGNKNPVSGFEIDNIPITGTYLFELTCTNSQGSSSANLTISVYSSYQPIDFTCLGRDIGTGTWTYCK